MENSYNSIVKSNFEKSFKEYLQEYNFKHKTTITYEEYLLDKVISEEKTLMMILGLLEDFDDLYEHTKKEFKDKDNKVDAKKINSAITESLTEMVYETLTEAKYIHMDKDFNEWYTNRKEN